LEQYRKCINTAKKHNDVMGLGHGYINGAYAFIHLNKLSKAEEYNEKGYEIFFLIGDPNMLTGVKVNNALIERKNGNHEKAIAIFKECDDTFKSLKLEHFHADMLFQIGMTYKMMKQKKKARRYFDQARKIYEKLNARHKMKRIKKERP
jgi:tetratricopeptide (TPR) repeat protein